MPDRISLKFVNSRELQTGIQGRVNPVNSRWPAWPPRAAELKLPRACGVRPN